MKTVILVHGWGGSPEKDWFGWATNEISKLGYKVICPEMPDPDEPKINLWVNKLKEIILSTNGELILIGHSIGCQTILRTLDSFEEKLDIEKIILVAPWWFLTVGDEEEKIAKPWYEQNIDLDRLKKIYSGIECFFSDNDPVVPLKINTEFFEKELNSNNKIIKGQGHFSEDDNPAVKSLPFLIELLT